MRVAPRWKQPVSPKPGWSGYTDRRLEARGSPGDPATQADTQRKLTNAAKGIIDDSAAGRIIDLVSNLERIKDVSELAVLLRSQ